MTPEEKREYHRAWRATNAAKVAESRHKYRAKVGYDPEKAREYRRAHKQRQAQKQGRVYRPRIEKPCVWAWESETDGRWNVRPGVFQELALYLYSFRTETGVLQALS